MCKRRASICQQHLSDPARGTLKPLQTAANLSGEADAWRTRAGPPLSCSMLLPLMHAAKAPQVIDNNLQSARNMMKRAGGCAGQ